MDARRGRGRGRPSARGRGHLVPTPEVQATGAGEQRQPGPPDMQETLAGILRAVDVLAASQLRQERRHDDRTATAQASHSGTSGTGDGSGATVLRDFMALRPPEFSGGADATVAEDWLLAVEKHLRSIDCAEAHRVRLGTFLLRGDAERWWETTRQRYGDGGPSWAQFVEAFNETYVPAWIREQKVFEFIELQQGSKTVTQYETEFVALSRYAPELVTPESRRVSKFQRGLRPEIRHAMAGIEAPDFPTAVQRAHAVERDQLEARAEQLVLKGAGSSSKKRKWDAGSQSSGFPQCRQCGQRHQGQCRERGHRANRCTQPAQSGGPRTGGVGPRLVQRQSAPRTQGAGAPLPLPAAQRPGPTERVQMQGQAFAVQRDNGLLLFRGRICVPRDSDIRQRILEEAHRSPYTIHPGATKMYQGLRRQYWWSGMKRSVAEFVSRCLVCQQVKAEHQRPAGLLRPLSVPEWKWERIAMDFVSGLPRSSRGYDSIWVIIDRLTKSAHFLPVKKTYPIHRLAKLYIDEVVRLHGVPASIVSDRDPRFTSRFWEALQSAMGTQLTFSTAFHPQTDGQSERTIRTLEDMLRACVLDFHGSWDDHLSLVEFAYNNSFQASIGMAPFEALYGRPCRSPLCWTETGERALLGPELVEQTTEKIQLIRARMKAAQDRQKSYADRRRRDLEFDVGDHVFLRVMPMRGVRRFGVSGKLSPRYVGPFEILERVGSLAYRLALPPQLAHVHDVFHVSMLRKYVADPGHVIDYHPLVVQEDSSYIELPTNIVDRKEKALGDTSEAMILLNSLPDDYDVVKHALRYTGIVPSMELVISEETNQHSTTDNFISLRGTQIEVEHSAINDNPLGAPVILEPQQERDPSPISNLDQTFDHETDHDEQNGETEIQVEQHDSLQHDLGDYQLARDRSRRIVRPPARYAYSDLIYCALIAGVEMRSSEYFSYEEAISSKDSKK
ncbi:uncharacterized protein LOC127799697 [Diospyros lotus]|uniref:uncharacterized protein LOC127799697 n=1 Tax=Diospyros lotus TaxID=55363 RepID=UPI00224F9A69|nr:uncharacterized protein LOC127799697 [Diospyros lotus]